MGSISNKSDILNRIKEYYKIKSNAELSRFLGISPSTLSNWYSRNTIDYDLIFDKCSDIDLDWLINGLSEYPHSENTEIAQLTEKERYITEPDEFNLNRFDWKDIYGFEGFSKTILKRNKFEQIDGAYFDIYSTIELIKAILEHYGSISKLSICHDDIKTNKCNIEEAINKASEFLDMEKELYDIIKPYKNFINELYAEIDEFNMKYDKVFYLDPELCPYKEDLESLQ